MSRAETLLLGFACVALLYVL